MAYPNSNEKRRYIDFSHLVVDYTAGDVVVFDNVRDLAQLYPLKPMTNLIALCVDGNLQVETKERNLKVDAGNILFCPPNVSITKCISSSDFTGKVFCLSDHLIQGLLFDNIDIWHRAVYVDHINVVKVSDVEVEEFGFYFSLIRSKIQHNTHAAPYEIIQALLRALLQDLCYVLENVKIEDQDRKLSHGKVIFNKFLGLISNNEVKRQPISEYASKLAITPKYLTMLCLKYSDKTASEWVIQYTTEDIRFYLRNSNLSIKEISAKLGFSNMSHFGSYVRKHLGISPSEYRRGRE